MKWRRLAWALTLGLVALVVGVRTGVLQPTPAGLGVVEGRLAPPSSTPNSVSSQARLHAGHPQQAYAAMEPWPLIGTPATALQAAATALDGVAGARIVTRRNDYLHAEVRSRWWGFVDDVEVWVDPVQGRVEFRSASRLGRRDFGVNRHRMEALRPSYEAAARAAAG